MTEDNVEKTIGEAHLDLSKGSLKPVEALHGVRPKSNEESSKEGTDISKKIGDTQVQLRAETSGANPTEYIIKIEQETIKKRAILEEKLVYREDGEFDHAVAPNGEKSHLSEKQWLQVRLTTFKEWFGDWENDPQSASKILDENGEPQVVYHGTTRQFDSFDPNAPKTFDIMENTKGVFYVASNREFAEQEYANGKRDFIVNRIRDFNEIFFGRKEQTWDKLIDKWNEFIRSIGTDRVNLYKKVPKVREPKGEEDYYNWTMVSFDGRDILATDEMSLIWGRKLPDTFNKDNYEICSIGGKAVLFPKNTDPIIMDLYVNSRNPNYKRIKRSVVQDMDDEFLAGMMEKGMEPPRGQIHLKDESSYGSKKDSDSIVVRFENGDFALGFFEPNQVKSATDNTGLFSKDNASVTDS